MEVTRILHVSLQTVGRLAATMDFYARVLSLPIEPRPATIIVPGTWLRAGDGQLHLNARAAEPGRVGPYPNHVCLGVRDIAVAIKDLTASGIPFVEAGSLDVRQIWLLDPAGHTIELQEDPTTQ